MSCPTNKKIYPTEEIAVEALLQARIRFDSNTAISVYECDDCNNWHLSSKGEMNVKLKDAIKSGKLDQEKKKLDWEERYKF